MLLQEKQFQIRINFKDIEICLFCCSKIEWRDIMASSKIKDITIEIGGNTTKLGKALEGVCKYSLFFIL